MGSSASFSEAQETAASTRAAERRCTSNLIIWTVYHVGVATPTDSQPALLSSSVVVVLRDRSHETRADTKREEAGYWALSRTIPEFVKLQKEDPAIGKVLDWKTKGKRPFGAEVCAESPETRHYWNYWNYCKYNTI